MWSISVNLNGTYLGIALTSSAASFTAAAAPWTDRIHYVFNVASLLSDLILRYPHIHIFSLFTEHILAVILNEQVLTWSFQLQGDKRAVRPHEPPRQVAYTQSSRPSCLQWPLYFVTFGYFTQLCGSVRGSRRGEGCNWSTWSLRSISGIRMALKEDWWNIPQLWLYDLSILHLFSVQTDLTSV